MNGVSVRAIVLTLLNIISIGMIIVLISGYATPPSLSSARNSQYAIK